VRRARKLLVPPLAVALGLAGALGLAAASAARADSTTSLSQLTSFGQIVVDSTDGYVFISEGPTSEAVANGGYSGLSSSGIVVTTLDGQYKTTIDGGDGVEGLALDGSTLYAALATQDEVGVINAATLTQTQAYPLPAGDLPYSLAMQSGELWVSYGTVQNGTPTVMSGAIGAMNPSTGTFTASAAGSGVDTWYSAPNLFADPSDAGALVAVQPGTTPVQTATFSTTTVPATTTAAPADLGGLSGANSCSFYAGLAVVPGGTHFLAACGAPANAEVYSTSDLTTPTGSYADPDTSYGSIAVAIAANGDVAVGTSQDVYVYQPGGTLVNSYTISSTQRLMGAGLAFSPDDSALYAITSVQPGGGPYSLNAYSSPTLAPTTATLTGPSSSVAGTPLTLNGTLGVTRTGVPMTSAPVTITRSASGGTPVTLAPRTTDSNGNFTVTDTPPAPGSYTYTARFPGDSSHVASTATAVVPVSARTSAITLSGPSSVVHGTSFTISGKLAITPALPTDDPTTIKVVRTNPNNTTTASTVTTAANGTFTIPGPLTTLGAYSYALSYAGTASASTATASYKLSVVNPKPTLTVSTGHSTALYGSAITVTAHLGTTHTNRTVTISASFPGSRTVKVLKTAAVNSSGNLVVSFPDAVRNVKFTATFAGDSQYAATSASASVGVDARVAMSNSGWYTSAAYSGVTYRVYHHTGTLYATITVTPNKSGECVRMNTQELVSGKWVATPLSPCFTLNTASQQSLYLPLTSVTYAHYRVQAVFVPSTSDVTNVSYSSGWFYFQVVQ
jgi:hypothetical protein